MPIDPSFSPDLLRRVQAVLDAPSGVPGPLVSPTEPPDPEASFVQLQAKMAARQTRPVVRRTPAYRSWTRNAFFGTGAAALAVVLWFTTQRSSPPMVTEVDSAPMTYATHNAQRATVTLSDGSIATLGPGTTVRVVNREVSLVGEAVFTVTPHSQNAFTVRTATAVTRVLGTTFGVRQYAGEAATRVAVAQGKVQVGDVVLTGGDIAAASDRTVETAHNAEAVIAALGFAQGKLMISDQTLADAAAELARWFDLDIRIDPAVLSRPFRATFQDETVTDALRLIAQLTNTTYRRDGRLVVFLPQ